MIACEAHRSQGDTSNTDLAALTASLLDDLAALLRRYIIFRSEHEANVLAAEILFTHVWHDGDTVIFPVTLYVYILGMPGSGKTKLLQAINELIADSTGRCVRWTEASLFRCIETRMTVIFDETHNMVNGPGRDGIISILNEGNDDGAFVPRVDPHTTDGVSMHNVYGPKWIAGQDVANSLADDTVERTVVIHMPHRPRARDELGRRFRLIPYRENEARPLKHRCQEWGKQAREYYRTAKLDTAIPDEIEDRQADAWEYLFAIGDLAGLVWGSRIRRAALALAVNDDTDETDIAELLVYDTAIKTTMIRKHACASDYFKRSEPPAISREAYGSMEPSDYGWHPNKSGSFTRLSVKADDRDKVTLRTHDFDVFWQAVKRANPAVPLPDARKVLRDLKAAGRLSVSGKGLKMPGKVWHDEDKPAQIVVIDITCWFTSGSITGYQPVSVQERELTEMLDKPRTDDSWSE